MKFPHLTGSYTGKVRDVFTIDDQYLIMIVSDRLSAFDVVLPRLIPFKGQVLNQIAAYMLQATREICPNWFLDTPAPNATIGRKCDPFKIEMVVRGNLTGHAWRVYSSGERKLCGISLPENMKENDFFPAPIITPSTKASEGHDEDISAKEIIQQGLATEEEWEKISDYSLRLFEAGKALAAKRGLILVDTKYEFGKIGDTIYLMDEIHTPDSSRYFYADGYAERQSKGEKQKQLSKEFVREWLIENNFMGKEGQHVPHMSDDWVEVISRRYIELYEQVIGEKFIPQKLSDTDTFNAIMGSLEKLGIAEYPA